MSRFACAVLVLLALSVARIANAAGIELSVTPLLGNEAPGERGWQAYLVRLRAVGGRAERGMVELTDGSDAATRAVFAVSAGEQAAIELYSHEGFGRGLEVVARSEDGSVVTRQSVPVPRSDAPLLVDLGHTTRLEAALRNERVAVRRYARTWAPSTGLELAVTHVVTDKRTGESLLPDRALGYSGATVVVVASDALIAMPERKANALLDWVRSGGALAITVAETADLSHPRLVAALGGAATIAPAPELGEMTLFEFDDSTGTGSPPAASYPRRGVPPSADVVAKLVRATGPALTPTRWGSRHALGLGNVHALGFDPTAPAFVDDPWVRRSMIDLVRVAWDARGTIGLTSDATFDEGSLGAVRRLLDPNEGSRWSIWFCAGLLVFYALLAGPLSFRRAARRGKPMLAFVELPLWSFGAALLIVVVGAVAKGGRSRARRLSVIECGAGERRGPIVRLRALFASSADSLRVASLDKTSLLDVAGGSSGAAGVARTLLLGLESAELVDLHGRPWETVLIREDGLTTLPGTVRFRDEGKDVRIENGLSRDLIGVVAHAPGSEPRYFTRIRQGESVLIGSGKSVFTSTTSFPSTIPVSPHRLDVFRFAALMNADAPGTSEAWTAIETASREVTDYWPDDRVALIAELQGADGAERDSDLRIDYDRVFLRVLGDAE